MIYRRLLVILLLGVILPTACGRPVVPLRSAPLRFRLPAVGGGYVTDRGLRGRPVILDIFAVWCRYCAYQARWELPDLVAWADAHGAKVILVSGSDAGGTAVPGPWGDPAAGRDGDGRPFRDTREALRKLAAYRRRFGIRAPVLYDSRLTLYRELHVHLFPTLFVLNGRGQLVGRFAGVGRLTAVERTARAAGQGTMEGARF